MKSSSRVIKMGIRSAITSFWGLLLCIFALGSIASATNTRVQISSNIYPVLYWLDSDNHTIFRCEGGKFESATALSFHHMDRKGLVTLKHCKPEELKRDGTTFTDLAVDGKNVYAIDGNSNTIFQMTHERITHSWSPFIGLSAAAKPHCIAARDGFIYVFDKENSSFSIIRKDNAARTVALSGVSVDRLVAYGNEVVGLDLTSKTIVRILLGADATDKAMKRVIAVETTVLSELSQPVDIAQKGSGYYILDIGRKELVIWSPAIADLGFASYSDFASAPTAIAGDADRLVFADGPNSTFTLAYNIEPMNITFKSGEASDGLAILYSELLKQKLLPVQSYIVKPDDTLQQVITNTGILPTGYSSRFDEVFCKLNKQDCSGGRVELPTGATVLLPYLQLRTFIGKGSIASPDKVPQGTSLCNSQPLANTTPLTLGDCQGKLYDFNPQLKNPSQVSASKNNPQTQITGIVIPEMIVRTSIISSSARDQYKHLLDELHDKAAISTFSDVLQPKGAEEIDTPNGSVTIPYLPPKYFTAINRTKALDAIPPVAVALVDTAKSPINANHTEFILGGASRVSIYVPSGGNATNTLIPITPPGDLGGHRQAQEWDHGTVTAALLAGSKVGVDPTANIFYVKLGDFTTFISDQKARIVNLSLGEKTYITRNGMDGGIADLLAQYRDTISDPKNYQTLFVIAAGNDDVEVQGRMLAGTGTGSNVIVVGGYDSGNPPRLWESDANVGSNRSIEYVHVVAPAEEIESATLDGSYAFASGTSLSTAIVSGIASEIMAKNPSWLPWQVKERIVATTDLEPWGSRAYSQGGAINEARALDDPAWDIITFLDREKGTSVECKGILDQEAQNKAITVRGADGKLLPLLIGDLKRLHQNLAGDFTLIYVHYDQVDADSTPGSNVKMSRIPGVSQSQLAGLTVKWTPDGGSACAGMTDLQLGQVTDFIAKMQ